VDDLVLKLHNCLTESERQQINSSHTNVIKEEQFFSALKIKDINAYEKWLIAMEDLCHSTLKEKWKMLSPSHFTGLCLLQFHP